MAAWWSLQRLFFPSFYWTKPRILCRNVVIVSTDDGTSCSPLLIRALGNTCTGSTNSWNSCNTRVRKSKEKTTRTNSPPVFNIIIVLCDKYYVRKVQSWQHGLLTKCTFSGWSEAICRTDYRYETRYVAGFLYFSFFLRISSTYIFPQRKVFHTAGSLNVNWKENKLNAGVFTNFPR